VCKYGNDEEIEQTINNGVDVNMKNERGEIPLIISCEKENLNSIINLIRNGAKTDISNSTGTSLLGIICKTESKKSLEIISYLIEKEKIDINFKDKNGNTPLLIACYFRNNKVIQKLIKNGTNTNIQNVFGDTPLIISYYFKNNKIVSELINEGNADIDISNNYGDTLITIFQKKTK